MVYCRNTKHPLCPISNCIFPSIHLSPERTHTTQRSYPTQQQAPPTDPNSRSNNKPHKPYQALTASTDSKRPKIPHCRNTSLASASQTSEPNALERFAAFRA